MLDTLSLIFIGAIWLYACTVGMRWMRAAGVFGRAATFSLGCALPTAGLLGAVHLLALISLFLPAGIVTPPCVLILYAAIIAFVRWRICPKQNTPDQPATQQPQDSTPKPKLWWLPAAIIAAMYAVFIFEALTRYPDGYDTLWYHLPEAVRWSREHALNLVPGLLDQSLPENGMVVPSLLIAAGLEHLLSLVRVPCALDVGLSVYALAVALGGSRKSASIAACVAFAMPVIVFQSVTCYIDIYAAAAWLAALLALVWATRLPAGRPRRTLLIIAGLWAGIALGSKTTYLVLVFLLFLIVAAVDFIARDAMPRTRPRPFRNVAVFAIATLACSGFWFARGIVQAHNPIYPLAVKIGEHKILPGWTIDDHVRRHQPLDWRIRHWLAYPWREVKKGQGYVYGVGNGLGALYTTLVPIGFAVAAFTLLKRRPRTPSGKWQLVLLALSVSAFPLVVTVFVDHLRYILPLVLTAIPVAVLALDRFIARRPRAIWALVTTALAVTAMVATFKPVHELLGRARDSVWTRPDFYQMPTLVDDLPPGTRILITRPQWRAWEKYKPVSDHALHEHDIDYVFTQDPEALADLDLQLIYNGQQQQQQKPWMAPKVYIYRVPTAPDDVRIGHATHQQPGQANDVRIGQADDQPKGQIDDTPGAPIAPAG
jgi:hypothetical protein